MRILVISDNLPSPSRPEQGLFNLRHAQALSMWAGVTVAHLNYAGEEAGLAAGVERETDGTLTITVPGSRVGRQLRASRIVADVARDFDVVHSMAFESLVACREVPRTGTAWVHSEHSHNFRNPEGPVPVRVWIAAARRLVRRPSLVTAVSNYLAEGIVRAGRERPTVVVPNVVLQSRPGAVRSTQADPVRIVSVGRCVASKGPDIAVGVIAELREHGLPAELTWIGDGPLRKSAEGLALRLGVADQVTFVGFMEPDSYRALLRQFDIFLLPTLHETFCVSAAEAIASGLPVVLGDVGGQRDYVACDNGILVPAGGPPEVYARAVRRILASDPPLPTPQAVQGLLARHSPAAVAEAFAAAYRKAGLL